MTLCFSGIYDLTWNSPELLSTHLSIVIVLFKTFRMMQWDGFIKTEKIAKSTMERGKLGLKSEIPAIAF